jgi:hypothetical protein
MVRALIRLTVFGATVAVPTAAVAQQPAPPAPAPSSCVAIMVADVQGMEGDATALGGSVRELVATFLRGPSAQVVMLDTRLTPHALEEARQKSCGHVLTMKLTRKRGGGSLFGRILGQAGSTAAWSIPGGSVASAVARGVTAAAAQAVSDVALSTKAKDEMRLAFTVTSLDGRPALGPKTEAAKAKTNGEDLLTPLAQRAAEAIVAKLSKAS